MLKKLLTSKGTIYLVYSSFLLSPKTYKSISNISLYNSLVLGITFATVACRLFKLLFSTLFPPLGICKCETKRSNCKVLHAFLLLEPFRGKSVFEIHNACAAKFDLEEFLRETETFPSFYQRFACTDGKE